MKLSRFARVIVDRAIQRELDYAIPEVLADRVSIGSRVRVPFRDRSALATVVALVDETSASGIREIEAVIGEGPTLSPTLLELARWISTYYCCPIETVMRSLLPQVIRRAQVGWKKQQFVQVSSSVSADTLATIRRRAPRQAELLDELSKLATPAPVAEILARLSLNSSTLRALVRRGFAKLHEAAVPRDPHGDEQFVTSPELTLNEEQYAALAKIVSAITSPEKAKPILLQGVTGSGKRRFICSQSGRRWLADAPRLCSFRKSHSRRKRSSASKVVLPNRRIRSRYCTVIYQRASAMMSGTKSIPVTPASLSVHGARSSRRLKIWG